LQHTLYPFRFHRLDSSQVVAVSSSGDFSFLHQNELECLVNNPGKLKLNRLAEMKSKFFIGAGKQSGSLRLLASRLAANKESVLSGPSLHIFVPTLQCAHSCKYCQVSRSLEDTGFSMTENEIDVACDTVFQSPSQTLTIEFQGGDPLLRFDLVRRAIDRISLKNRLGKRTLRFVIASTLHQLTDEMCHYLKEHQVYLSTSLDGPESLHNHNRPLPTKDAYQRTLAGINLARKYLGEDSVSALMTTTKESLEYPEEIVDEYVKLGFSEIFLRPLSLYGFAKRNESNVGYSHEDFKRFYERAFNRVLYWNKQGRPLKEDTAAVLLNKMLSPFDGGYVDLQSPSGAGLAVLVYNYDGYVYPSDEARMLAESGDSSLRLGKIGASLSELLDSTVMRNLISSSLVKFTPGCNDCAFNTYCGPNPVDAQSAFGAMSPPVFWTDHCKRHMWLFDFLFRSIKDADEGYLNLIYDWALPNDVSLELKCVK
jgi:His-Xaa-Ser system radical SAM maturase HxsB